MKQSREFIRIQREITFVNCWHIRDDESSAMWNGYLGNCDGVVIESSYQRPKDSLSVYEDFDVFVGKINYLNYETETIPQGNIFYPILHKRHYYTDERELRAFIWTLQNGKNDVRDNKYKDTPGLYVNMAIDVLVVNVFVKPTAHLWVLKLLQSLADKYNLNY